MERNLGMNKMNHFPKVLPLIYQYSYAHELEYSSYVMILAYELVYSFYVMILVYRTLCLVFHIMFMSRIRAMLMWWIIMPLGVPMSFTC